MDGEKDTAPGVDKGADMIITEFCAQHPEYPRRQVYRFIDHGMPHRDRGGVFFLYEQEALAWIAQHVDIAPSFRFKD